ncbi:TPA: hypothetical protein L9J87_002188 [Klebsiella pneumoniae]|nr:hypothetical protein [Klebsiella pneumoniae]
MTSKFSIDNRELLQRISSGEAVVGIDFGNLIVRELAAFRLSAMDSEPVLWAWHHLDMWHVTSHDGRARDLGLSGFKVIPLYRHAQPAQASMKDHQIRELVNELRDIAIDYHGTQQLRERIARTVRAAMLAADTQEVKP